jgi:EmrB/QacA subfamily drug resistance transporter
MLSEARQPCDEAILHSMPFARECAQTAERWVLIAAILGSSITFIDGTVVNVVLPVLQTELGADVTQVQWIVELYALMLSALILVGGSLGDRFGRRRIFMIGVAIFAVASMWCGLSPNIDQLIIARGVQGVGAAMLVPGSLALISANFDKDKRGSAIGTWSGFTSIAAGVGPLLGGWLVQTISWRWIFFINIPLAAAVFLISWFFVPESRNDEAHGRLDWLGATLATIGLGGIVFALIESNAAGFRSTNVILSFVIGAVAFAAFIFVESRAKDPMLPLGLFGSHTFAGANLLTLFLYAGLGGLLFFLPFMLIQVSGLSPSMAGATLLPFVLTMFVLSRWAGGLVTRYGSKLPLIVGPSIAAAGFVLYGLLPRADSGYWTSYFPATIVMSLGMAVSVAPLTTTVMGAVDARHAGIASGINNSVSRVASLIAVAAFGVIMLASFRSGLERRLDDMSMPPDTKSQIALKSGDLLNLPIPTNVDQESADAIRSAARDSFVEGFRLTSYTSAGLALLSALSAWLLIDGKKSDRLINRSTRSH